MHYAVGGYDALRIMRALRCEGVALNSLERADLAVPDSAPYQRFTSPRFDLGGLRLEKAPDGEHPLTILIGDYRNRIRAACVRNVRINPANLAPKSFLEVGGGIQIPCPELLFIQMGALMPAAMQLALAMEFTGSFARDAAYPNDAAPTYGLPPASSRAQILSYLEQCHQVTGISGARQVAPFITDNAWSPMEAALAALFLLSFEDAGYGLGPLELNQRTSENTHTVSGKNTRVPDILFGGTQVGLNYDGGDHLNLKRVADAARELTLNPESASVAEDYEAAMREVRAKYVDDRRRDRELWARGLRVMSVTAEDLVQPQALDRIALWVAQEIAREGSRDMTQTIRNLSITYGLQVRQLLIWAMLPGERGRRARKQLANSGILNYSVHPTLDEYVTW